jgi:hypothetical protein
LLKHSHSNNICDRRFGATPKFRFRTRDGGSAVVSFFHEEEQEDETYGAKDSAPVQDPLPALSIGDEASNNGRKEIAASQK